MMTKDRLKTVETELEMSQDQVSKLTAEVDDNNKNASLYAIDVDNMKLVRDFQFLSSFFYLSVFILSLSINIGVAGVGAWCSNLRFIYSISWQL